jgi:hypothetical protein
MDLGGWLLGLLTVFLGALLAFLVDNLRERRRLREWTRRYLHEVRTGLAQTLTLRDGVLDALTASATATDLLLHGEEPDWEALSTTTVTAPPALMESLRGEGLSAVPPDVVGALQRLENVTAELHLRSVRLESRHERLVLPLYLSRQRPSPEESRGLELFERELSQFSALAEEAFATVGAAVDALRQAGY